MIRSPLAELLALLVPPACPACRTPLADAGAQLCRACARELPWLGSGCCERCALPAHRGDRCPAIRAAFARAWAPLAYEGAARRLVAALKFRGALPVADVMAAQLAANLPPDLRPPGPAPSGWVVVPVPPHPRRRRQRGFDPAGALAARFAARIALPLDPCLRRHDRSGRQAREGRGERRRPGRLAIEAPGAVATAVLLVDDVHTTGATLDASAAALRQAGARHVVAVTFARTLAARTH